MRPDHGHTPWLEDEVHEAVGRLTFILDVGAKDALIVLRQLARGAGVSLVTAADTVNGSGLEALRALAVETTGESRRDAGPPSGEPSERRGDR